jgi:hypothetical protein
LVLNGPGLQWVSVEQRFGDDDIASVLDEIDGVLAERQS